MGMKTDPETHAKILAAGLPPAHHGEPEGDFQRRVIALARRRGWAVVWIRPVRIQRANGQAYYETPVGADGKGFVDLVIVRDRILYRELKTDKGELRPDQVVWFERLRTAGADVAVWRPCLWAEILEALK